MDQEYIPVANPRAQYLAHQEEIDTAIHQVLSGGRYILGEAVTNFERKFADYLSLMLICPILIILSSSVTIFITTQITLILEKITFLGAFSSAVLFLVELLPYVLLWGLFTFLYIFMPNTKVRFTSGLLAGIITGTLFQILQWGYITFQIGAAHYNAIYGSFAAFPLFLVWLQLSWLIILYGAELSFAYQNVDTYEFEPDCNKVSNHFKRILALRLTQLCVQDFQAGESPRTAEQLSAHLAIPIRLVRQVISDLTEARVLSEVTTEEEKTPAYQPARAIDSLTVAEVVNLLDQSGVDTIPSGESRDWAKLAQRLALFKDKIRDSSVDAVIRDL